VHIVTINIHHELYFSTHYEVHIAVN